MDLNWFTSKLEQYSVLWMILSGVIGGLIGATIKFTFEVWAPERLKSRRESNAVGRRYRVPLVLAAEDLRRRLGNIRENIDQIEAEEWLDYDAGDQVDDHYYYWSTVYAVARFFAWVQVMHRSSMYVGLNPSKLTQRIEFLLYCIERGLTDPAIFSENGMNDRKSSVQGDIWVFSYDLEAVGDILVVSRDKDLDVMDYSTFLKTVTEKQDLWFIRQCDNIGRMFRYLRKNEPRFERIKSVQQLVNLLLRELDPNRLNSRHTYLPTVTRRVYRRFARMRQRNLQRQVNKVWSRLDPKPIVLQEADTPTDEIGTSEGP